MRRGRRMKKELQGDMVFDTSIFIEIIAGTYLGRKLMEILLDGKVNALTTESNIAELSYIACRKVGWERGKENVQKITSSGYIEVLKIGSLLDRAAKMKCDRSISLVDCFTITAGEVLGVDVLFAKREDELERELARKPFEVRLIFAEDLLAGRDKSESD
ncbi:MAG: PIN domain-containing protein [Candidatus Korarchaeota archaeon]|nr:PIN domain-containing protein [Candidatus Korarchaeota archaeon]